MDTIALLKKYFPDRDAFAIVLEHSRQVAAKARHVAQSVGGAIDLKFIEEAAMLHDIGVCRTNAPGLCCYGTAPYIRHGIIGREILEAEGFAAHALVCERHIGVGLTVQDIIEQDLPLPHREMSPTTREERIICFADLFFSKRLGSLKREKPIEEVMTGLQQFGRHKTAVLAGWLREFTP